MHFSDLCPHTSATSLSPVLHTTLPLGPVITKEGQMRDEQDREVWNCCLDPAILPTVKSFLRACGCVPSRSLYACLNCMPSCLSECARACILTVSSFAKKVSLQGPAACHHSSLRCQNVVSSKQSDDILSVIQTACIDLHWRERTAPASYFKRSTQVGAGIRLTATFWWYLSTKSKNIGLVKKSSLVCMLCAHTLYFSTWQNAISSDGWRKWLQQKCPFLSGSAATLSMIKQHKVLFK